MNYLRKLKTAMLMRLAMLGNQETKILMILKRLSMNYLRKFKTAMLRCLQLGDSGDEAENCQECV